jgi:hypothetical protein
MTELRRVQLAEGFDQIGLAMEIDRVPVGGGIHLVDPGWCCRFSSPA